MHIIITPSVSRLRTFAIVVSYLQRSVYKVRHSGFRNFTHRTGSLDVANGQASRDKHVLPCADVRWLGGRGEVRWS
jgi:hypothetical protein